MSERDIEKEHHTQLKLWMEKRGELHYKSPPRMHGAKAIMNAEPPSRQDLRQNPTIIVQSPLEYDSSDSSSLPGSRVEEEIRWKRVSVKPNKEEKKEKKEKTLSWRSRKALQDIPNPYALLDDPQPVLDDPQPLRNNTPVQGSNQSLSSMDHDTYL